MQVKPRGLHSTILFLTISLALIIVADASSKNNRPIASSSNSINVEIKTGDAKSKGTIKSETKISSAKKREKRHLEKIDGKRKRDSSSRNDSDTRSSQGGISASLRRIKKEYKDAVEMGIAYDWENQRLIQRKIKGRPLRSAKNQDHAIICLGPITTNLRQWHFSFWGAGEGSYSKGIYHGQIMLPKDYPLSPPSVQMWTPSGRFVPYRDICLSASNYHPESWTPRWSIQGIVNALRLHMLTPPTEIGGMESTHEENEEYARLSLEWKKTWVSRGSNGNKKTRVTVDHRLLVTDGILSKINSLETRNEETEEEIYEGKENISSSTSDENNSFSDLDQAVHAKTNSDAMTRDGVADSKLRKDKRSSRLSARFGFSNDAVASIFQLAILYMIVFLFLNR